MTSSSGEIAALAAVIGMALSYFNLGSLVPLVGPALAGLIPVATFIAAAWAAYQHRQLAGAVRAGRV